MAIRTHTSNRVLIVGGGISGLATAVRLAQAGLPVTVFESSHLGFGSSTRNQGWLYSGAWFAPEQPELARMCYKSLQQTLSFCPECLERHHGSMVWMISNPDTSRERWTDAWKTAGIPFEGLPTDLAVERIPDLDSSEIREAFQLPDRAIRYDLLLRRLAEEAESSGAEIRGGTKVERLIRTDGDVQGVATSFGEEITARMVVLAGNAAGLALIPGYGEQKVGRQSDYELIALKTHLLAIRPGVSRWPFCIVDADGFNHMPHAPSSVFGTDRWLPAADPQSQVVIRAEIDRIWEHIGRFFPDLRRKEVESLDWAGSTVQAMHVEQAEPGRVPWPTVIDHEQEPDGLRHLLSVFAGRASLWAPLAEDVQRIVLEKLGKQPEKVASPPWGTLEPVASTTPRTEAEDVQNVLVYHCQTCGNVVYREAGLQPPVCCTAVMAKAAADTSHDATRG